MKPTKNNSLMKNITFPSVILSGSALLTITIIGWLLKYCYYGLDLTDEGFYLNWIANPWIYKASVSQFGFIYHPLHLLTHGHIAQLRQINLLIIFGLYWALLFIFFKTTLTATDRSNFWHTTSISVLAASLATSGFIYCCPFSWLVTPSYNSLTFQGLLIASIGALLAGKSTLKYNLIGWILIGVAGWLVFMAKPSSAAALFFAMGGYLLIAGKFQFKHLGICLLTTTIFFLITAYLIDGSLIIFIKRYLTGFTNMKLLGLENTIFRFDGFILNSKEKTSIFIGTIVLSLVSYFAVSTKKYAVATSYAITFILLLISFLNIFNLLPSFIQGHHFFTMQIIIIPFSAVILAITLSGKKFFDQMTRNHWALMLFFLALPYVFAFGTTNNYSHQSQLVSCFWILSGLSLLTTSIITTSKWLVFIPLAVATQCLTVFFLQHAMELPYRQNQPLRDLHHQTTIESTHSLLVLNEDNSNFYQYLQTEVNNRGFLPGTPLIDLSGHSPGLIYIMNGKAIGQAWTIGGYPGSDNLALASLSGNVSCEEMATTWILIEPESPLSISPAILKHFGINIEKDYTLATEFKMPKGMVDGNNYQRNIQLLKPYRTAQKSFIACKKIKSVA